MFIRLPRAIRGALPRRLGCRRLPSYFSAAAHGFIYLILRALVILHYDSAYAAEFARHIDVFAIAPMIL